MKRAVALVLVSLAACERPSQKARDAERAAYDAFVDAHLEFDRVMHACDAEHKAYMDSMDLYLQALKGSDRRLQTEVEHERSLADLKNKTCESKLPPLASRWDDMRVKGDAWLDACLECASGKKCVAIERTFRRTDKPTPELRRAHLEELRTHSGCSVVPARSLAAR